MASVIIEQQVRIPLSIRELAGFRRWAHSSEFPEDGRIDYIGGDIEVDMSPEDLFTHGTLKTKITAVLLARVEELDLGHLFTDSTRISNVAANLSVEPDLVLVTHGSLDEGTVHLVPKSGSPPDRFVEIEGTPDLVLEIVSDSSHRKDTQRLREAYYQAGIPEYWIVDARGAELQFQINVRGAGQYEPAGVDADGYQRSGVLSGTFRLDRRRGRRGYWQYTLDVR